MPLVLVQRYASPPLEPTIIEPSADTLIAKLWSAPGSTPIPTMPSAAVQRNASPLFTPAMVDASAEIEVATLNPEAPARPCVPSLEVQRNASVEPFWLCDAPTIAEPSAETSVASLSRSSTWRGGTPSRCPRPAERRPSRRDRGPHERRAVGRGGDRRSAGSAWVETDHPLARGPTEWSARAAPYDSRAVGGHARRLAVGVDATTGQIAERHKHRRRRRGQCDESKQEDSEAVRGIRCSVSGWIHPTRDAARGSRSAADDQQQPRAGSPVARSIASAQ